MQAQALNPFAFDPYGYKGDGTYSFSSPYCPFGRVMWAGRQADGRIRVADDANGPVVADLTDDEFRSYRDWPVPYGDRGFFVGSTPVETLGFVNGN